MQEVGGSIPPGSTKTKAALMISAAFFLVEMF
jgi:hypothetical protein